MGAGKKLLLTFEPDRIVDSGGGACLGLPAVALSGSEPWQLPPSSAGHGNFPGEMGLMLAGVPPESCAGSRAGGWD